MDGLQRLFFLEVEFFRLLRVSHLGLEQGESVHTSYALRNGYEQLIATAGTVKREALEALAARYMVLSDPRDVLRAKDSLSFVVSIHRLLP